ncbi:cohesin domain-containing protein [Methanolobus sp. WCC4]|uniref:cohesin domain-containing protein n=1 Tax=Methanolobus sp. WCC4 TaxID=3125784 RepID=UPI0030F96672
MIRPVFRKLSGIILIFLCIVFLSGMATASTSVSIVPSSHTAGPGKDLTLEVHVKPDTAVAGLQFDLSYDNRLVDINNIKEGDFFASTGSAVMFNPGIIDEQKGTVSMIYSAVIMGDPVSDEGIFCTIDITTGYNNGPCELRITDVVLGDVNGNELPVVTFDSIINIDVASENDEEADSNDEGTEFNIIQKQDEEAIASQEPEQSGTGNENLEAVFASIDDPEGAGDLNENEETEFTSTGASGVTMLALAVIAFFAIAYFLDRKK